MPLTKPAFFQSDRLPRWRAAGLSTWIWLRLRFRHNPGFVTAAAAGSIGLVLALYLMLNGALGFFGSAKSSETETADRAELGDEGEPSPQLKPIASSEPMMRVRRGTLGTDGNGGGVGGGVYPLVNADQLGAEEDGLLTDDRGKIVERVTDDKVAIAKPKKQPAIDDEPLFVEEPSTEEPESNESPANAPEKAIVFRERPPLVEEKEEEEEPKADDDRGFLSHDEPLADQSDDKPAADDSPPARTNPAIGALPLLADDGLTEEADDDAKPIEDEPQKSQPQPTTVVTAPPQSKTIADDAPAGDDDPFLQPQPKSSWKDSKAKPLPPVKEPAAGAATQSRAVETAVYATQEPQEKPRRAEARPAAEPSKLALEICAPKFVSAGQTFDLEFVVTNNSRQPVEGALLSVALPAGLVHPQGPELEQPIVSLAGCQRYRGRMKVKAIGAGDVSPRADVSVRGKIGAQSTVTLRVGDPPRQVRSGALEPCACEPVRLAR